MVYTQTRPERHHDTEFETKLAVDDNGALLLSHTVVGCCPQEGTPNCSENSATKCSPASENRPKARTFVVSMAFWLETKQSNSGRLENRQHPASSPIQPNGPV